MPAVVADEVALCTGLIGKRLVEDVQALVQIEEVVRGSLTKQHGDVDLDALLREVDGAVLVELGVQVGNTGSRLAEEGAIRPLASGGSPDLRLVDVPGEHVRSGRVEQCRPRGAGNTLGGETLGQVVPGDLRSQCVQSCPSLVRELVQRRHRLVAAAIAPADGPKDGVVGDGRARGVGVVCDPVERGDVVDDDLYVLGLAGRILHVGQAPALSVAPLVDADHAEARIEHRLHVSRGRGGSAPVPAVGMKDHRDVQSGVDQRGAGLEDRDHDLLGVTGVGELHPGGFVRRKGLGPCGRGGGDHKGRAAGGEGAIHEGAPVLSGSPPASVSGSLHGVRHVEFTFLPRDRLLPDHLAVVESVDGQRRADRLEVRFLRGRFHLAHRRWGELP